MAERRFHGTPGVVCSLGLHVVLCPKYRRWILGGRIARWLGELLEQIADEGGWRFVAKELMPDHVHMGVFVRVGPSYAPARVVWAFKGSNARMPGQKFAHLPNDAKVLWSPSYFAASVEDASGSIVRRYIEHQWGAVAS
jgi:putative transposase